MLFVPPVTADSAEIPRPMLPVPVVTPVPIANLPIAILSSPVVAAPNEFNPAAILQVPPA